MVFNATFNNISAISWWPVLLVEETGVPGENHQPVASPWQTLSHNVVSSTSAWAGFKLKTLVLMGTNCIGSSCKFNYHTIMTMTAPYNEIVFSYLMVAGAIDWNVCPEVLGMTKGQMFQSIAPETIK